MEFQEFLILFNSYWFEYKILLHFPISATTLKTNQNLETNEQAVPNLETNEQVVEIEPKLSKIPSFMVRSQSDHCLSSKDSSIPETPSPKSVLVEPKLEPILSGKEYNEFEFSEQEGFKNKQRKKKKSSKSLSELEFEELKGFMDLGFEFSDKDCKDSSLVTILPGLKRLGKENEDILGLEESGVSRPHLSEAWGFWEEKRKKERNPLKSWRINPNFGNEMEIKDQLKFWAHTVASTVR